MSSGPTGRRRRCLLGGSGSSSVAVGSFCEFGEFSCDEESDEGETEEGDGGGVVLVDGGDEVVGMSGEDEVEGVGLGEGDKSSEESGFGLLDGVKASGSVLLGGGDSFFDSGDGLS